MNTCDAYCISALQISFLHFFWSTCIFAWCPSFPSLFRGIPRVWKFPLKVTFSPFEFQIDVCWDTFVCCTAKSVNVCGSDFRKCGKCYKLSLDVFPLYWHTQGISCRLSFLPLFWLWFLYQKGLFCRHQNMSLVCLATGIYHPKLLHSPWQ